MIFALEMEIILDQFIYLRAKILFGAMSNLNKALFEDSYFTSDFLFIDNKVKKHIDFSLAVKLQIKPS